MARRANGEGSWGKKTINGVNYITFKKTYAGKRKEFYGKTKSEINKKVAEYENKNQLTSETEIQKMTWQHYCHEWLYTWRKQNIKQKTFDYYDMIINNYINDTKLGNMQIKFLNNGTKQTTSNIFETHINVYKDTLSKSTIDGIYTVFNQVCKFAFKKGDINFNWMENIDKLSSTEVSKKKKEKISLTFNEIMQLYDEMQRKNTSEFRINGKQGTYVYGVCAYALLFVAFTGCRWGEVSCIKWSDVDLENKILKIDKQFVLVKNRSNNTDKENNFVLKEDTPKSKDSIRLIPLCEQAIEILMMVEERFNKKHKPNDIVFTNKGTPLQQRNANRTLKSMCIRQGLPEITPHELRHSFASVLLNQDKQNLYTVSSLLGHSSTDVTYKTYIHIFEEEKAKTINIFDKLKEANK